MTGSLRIVGGWLLNSFSLSCGRCYCKCGRRLDARNNPNVCKPCGIPQLQVSAWRSLDEALFEDEV